MRTGSVRVPLRSPGRGGRRGIAGVSQELMDLRLHRPRPDAVIVRVSGPVDALTAPVLAERVGKQLDRAPFVVLDLGGVSVLGPQGLTILLMLHQEAMARGVELHIVGVERDVVRRPLHARGLGQLVRFDSTVDAVIAELPRPMGSHVDSRPTEPGGDPRSRLRSVNAGPSAAPVRHAGGGSDDEIAHGRNAPDGANLVDLASGLSINSCAPGAGDGATRVAKEANSIRRTGATHQRPGPEPESLSAGRGPAARRIRRGRPGNISR